MSPPQQAPISTKRTGKRRVRFAQVPAKVIGTVLSLEDYTTEELDSCWWTDDDMQGIRLNAQYIASRARKSALLKNVARVYMKTQDITAKSGTSSCQNNETRRQNALHSTEENQDGCKRRRMPQPKELIPHLEKWSETAHSVRGLERLACPVIFDLRRADAQTACEIVLDRSEKGLEVSKAYREMSMTSSLFARLVGHADSVAAEREYGNLRMCGTHSVKQTELRQSQVGTVQPRKDLALCNDAPNQKMLTINVPVQPIYPLEKREINTRAA